MANARLWLPFRGLARNAVEEWPVTSSVSAVFPTAGRPFGAALRRRRVARVSVSECALLEQPIGPLGMASDASFLARNSLDSIVGSMDSDEGFIPFSGNGTGAIDADAWNWTEFFLQVAWPYQTEALFG